MNDLHIYQEIMDDVDLHTGLTGNAMPRYEYFPEGQRLIVLNDMLKAHTLRQIGDVKRYLRLQAEIMALDESMEAPPIYKIMQWLDKEMDPIKPVTEERNVVVLSLLVFGEKYVERFIKYTLKSLMAFENLPCMALEKRVIIYIQTDEASKQLIESAPIVKAIKALWVVFDYTIIPDDVISTLKQDDTTYWMLGAAASLGVHYAKALGGVFHHCFPDMVYSSRFFSELMRLSKDHKAILCGGMRSDETRIAPHLKKYETDIAITIPASDLISHHMNCLHLVAWPYVVNNRQYDWQYPLNHILIWESEDAVIINGPHLNPIWLDYSVIKNLPDRFYWTLDSEMDMICKGEDFYIPQECDDLYQAEISEPNRAFMQDKYSHAIGFAQNLWNCMAHRDMLKFFLRGNRIKLNKDIRICKNPMQKSQIDAESMFLFNTMLATDPYTQRTGLERTHDGRIYG